LIYFFVFHAAKQVLKWCKTNEAQSMDIKSFFSKLNCQNSSFKATEITLDRRSLLGEELVASFGFACFEDGCIQVATKSDLLEFLQSFLLQPEACEFYQHLSHLTQNKLEIVLVKYRLTADGRCVFPKVYVRWEPLCEAMPFAKPILASIRKDNFKTTDVEIISYFPGFPELGYEVYFNSGTLEQAMISDMFCSGRMDVQARNLIRGCLTKQGALPEDRRQDYISSSFDLDEQGNVDGKSVFFTLSDFRPFDEHAYNKLAQPFVHSPRQEAPLADDFKLELVAVKERAGKYHAFPCWASIFHYFLKNEYF
jgi:hypothetical protein